jgi:microcompartment protein CcmL/EutN
MEALGLFEIQGWSPTLIALDPMTKAAKIVLLQVELNDLYGACIKILGASADVEAAVAAGREVANDMRVQHVSQIPRPSAQVLSLIPRAAG